MKIIRAQLTGLRSYDGYKITPCERVNVLLGALLGISTAQYNKTEPPDM